MKTLLTGLLIASSFATAQAAAINQVSSGALTGTGLITFEDVAVGNFDSIFESDGASFAERFVGQTLSYSGDFDVLSGSPSGSLTLMAGLAAENLSTIDHAGSRVLTGNGPVGYPAGESIGEGSFAVLFDYDQSEFGISIVGGNGGSATIGFYRRDGSVIDTLSLSGLAEATYGFQRDGGVNDIAGIAIWNLDGAGVGFDNLIHDVPGVEGPGNQPVPEPATVVGAFALAALMGRRMLARKR